MQFSQTHFTIKKFNPRFAFQFTPIPAAVFSAKQF
jgi:hypothetical protein